MFRRQTARPRRWSPTALLLLLSLFGCAGDPPATDPESLAMENEPIRIIEINPDRHQMKIVMPVTENPHTGESSAYFGATWTDDTRFTQIEERSHFGGIDGPVTVQWKGIREKDAEAFAAGEPFEARVATVLPDSSVAPTVERNRIVGRFTPDPGPEPRGGTLTVDDRSVHVKLRRRHARLFVRTSMTADQVADGFWHATLDGRLTPDGIAIEQLRLYPRPDPLT
ncbi:MAG: hypothetical protein R3336_06370, partial [Phycisphaeraceae bacterium]|nr:hypothetical protein [Phycisphaeraceae bacterium]